MASSAFGALLRGIRVAVKIMIAKVDLQDSKSDGGTAGVLAQFARIAVRVEYHRRAPGPLRACSRSGSGNVGKQKEPEQTAPALRIGVSAD